MRREIAMYRARGEQRGARNNTRRAAVLCVRHRRRLPQRAGEGRRTRREGGGGAARELVSGWNTLGGCCARSERAWAGFPADWIFGVPVCCEAKWERGVRGAQHRMSGGARTYHPPNAAGEVQGDAERGTCEGCAVRMRWPELRVICCTSVARRCLQAPSNGRKRLQCGVGAPSTQHGSEAQRPLWDVRQREPEL